MLSIPKVAMGSTLGVVPVITDRAVSQKGRTNTGEKLACTALKILTQQRPSVCEIRTPSSSAQDAPNMQSKL